MLIHVRRVASGDDATIGALTVDGSFQCFTLEDEKRAVKVAGETRIPAGRYRVKVRRHGGFHGRYSRRFPDLHRGMLEIADVPGFSDILIHVGNYTRDTAGCLLVGMGANIVTDRGWTVTQSTAAYKRIYARVIDAAAAGKLEIQIDD